MQNGVQGPNGPRTAALIPGTSVSSQSNPSITNSSNFPLLPQANESAEATRTSNEWIVHEASAAPRRSSDRPVRASYLGDTGGLQLFTVETAQVESPPAEPLLTDRNSPLDEIPHDLLQSYLETYFEQIFPWCPVLDRPTIQQQPEILDPPMLRHALALCGTTLRPPLISHTPAIIHYRRAKGLFYANYEDNLISQITAMMLFYWYSPGPPNVASLDTNWWWISVSARVAQNIGLHRELTPDQRNTESTGLRRRIWWTLFVSTT